MRAPDSDDTAKPSESDEENEEMAESPMLVFEFTIPPEAFVLGATLAEFPDLVLEYERLVPTNHAPLPYLWTNANEPPGFEEALAEEPKVDGVENVATFEEGCLYKLHWRRAGDDLLDRLTTEFEDVALLEASGQRDRWQLKFRLPSREVLDEIRALFVEQEVPFDVVRLYELENPKVGQFNVSEKQRAGLLRALEMGYFEIPREATLEEVADSLGISSKSLSERLRRGQTNLLTNSITVGAPSGVGIPDQ